MIKKLLSILFFIILAGGCTSPLSKFKCIYDLYGDSTVYYEITINGDYLKTVKHKHTIVSKFDSINNVYGPPRDSFFVKKDSIFLTDKVRDSLILHIENAINTDVKASSCISTNTSIITINWNKKIYRLHYNNVEQRALISFLKKHSSIRIR